MAIDKNQLKLDNITKHINKSFDKVLDKKTTKKLGESLAQDIVKRTRLGFGVINTGENKHKLLPLSEPYVEKRRVDARNGKLSSRTTPRKSNLTKTGQLLDSIDGRGKKAQFEVYLKKENRTDTNTTNSEIVFHQEGQGRPFIHASRLERKRLNRKIFDLLIKELKKLKVIK